MKISEYCKKIRETKGLNVLSFSELLNCSHSYILKIESGVYDDPTALVVAKIILKYNLDLDEFLADIDNNFTPEFIDSVKRHLYKNIGTKLVINKKNIISKFYKDYLIPNGYKDVDESLMTGNVIVNQATFKPITLTDDSFVSIEDSISKEKATIYPEVDYVCVKDNRLCFVCILNIRSTIVVNVDKEKLLNDVNSILADIANGYFETANNNMKYDIIMITPSEKIFNFLKDELSRRKIGLREGYRLGIALVRPKRPIIEPYYFC